MNRSAVALAADSAVSIPYEAGTKTFRNARKLMAAHLTEPVCVMFYDSPDIAGLPWSTIIGEFARTHTHIRASVQEYADHLFDFVQQELPRWDQPSRDLIRIAEYSSGLLQMLDSAWGRTLNAGIPNNPDAYSSAANGVVDVVVAQRATSLPSEQQILYASQLGGQSLHDPLVDVFSSHMGGLWDNLDGDHRGALVQAGRRELSTIKRSEKGRTGVVLAGFGSTQLFPAAHVFVVAGTVGGILRHAVRSSIELGVGKPSVIIPLAHQDTILSVLRGLHPKLYAWFRDRVFDLLGAESDSIGGVEESKRQFRDEVDRRLREQTRPVTDAVGFLPPKDLAELARALISLTALQQRASMQPETVGTPIDVALVTRTDGIRWVELQETGTRPDTQVY